MAKAKSAIPMGGPTYDGEVKGSAHSGDDYAKPYEPMPQGLGEGFGGVRNEALDKPGFETSGYITKKGTCYGEAAKFNYLPPGMDIENQENSDQRELTMKKITNMGYPGDGWE